MKKKAKKSKISTIKENASEKVFCTEGDTGDTEGQAMTTSNKSDELLSAKRSSLKMASLPKSRKRSLPPPQVHVSVDSIQDGMTVNITNNSSVSEKQQKRIRRTNSAAGQKGDFLILKSKVVAISTLVEGSKESDPHTYKSICVLCERMGAKVTGQVHKRVHCVIATTSAVTSATQRVRKAWKKGIPVVDVAWLEDCQGSMFDNILKSSDGERLKVLDFDSYRKFPPSVSEISKKRPKIETATKSSKTSLVDKKTGESIAKESTAVDMNERELDLGCCCVCHENSNDVTVATDCNWCVDCSVNKTLQRRTS